MGSRRGVVWRRFDAIRAFTATRMRSHVERTTRAHLLCWPAAAGDECWYRPDFIAAANAVSYTPDTHFVDCERIRWASTRRSWTLPAEIASAATA